MRPRTIHRTDFKTTLSIPVTVEFEAFPECPGSREGGTGLLLSPNEPAYIDVISVKVGETTVELNDDAMEELKYEIAESLAGREE